MKDLLNSLKGPANRRSFIKKGLAAAATATVGAGLLANGLSVFGQDRDDDSDDLTRGDIAILRLLTAAELIEEDLWRQYSELGGVQDAEVSGVNRGNPLYMAALQILDGDMSQYVRDNTDDEISHARFLNAYLESRGAPTVHFDRFRQLPSSKSGRGPANRTAHQPHAAHGGHQLLDAVPQHYQPRFRCDLRSGRPEFK